MDFNNDSSDDSNDLCGAIKFDQGSVGSPGCQIMTDSGSDDDSNNEQSDSHIKHHSYSSDHEDIAENNRHSSDDDMGYSKNVLTDSSANEVESYSPSKDLRRRSVELRNSYGDYSPHSKKRRIDSYSTSRNPVAQELHFVTSDSGNHSRDNYVPTDEYDRSEKKSKSHGSKKRKYDELSSSSHSQGFFSPERQDSVSDYSLPAGTSLNKPLKGGIGASIMNKMGFQSGKGLGKRGEGRLDPIELSRQKGRQGLGLSIPNLDHACDFWEPSLEVVEVKEKVDWLEGPDIEAPDCYELENWMEEGPRDLDIANMSDFCDAHLLSRVLSCKSVFDNMEGLDMVKARSRSNPFETLRKGIFQNRAAMKMANIDAIFDFMFTNPTDRHGDPMVTDNKLLYFADVCAGPGGFSEYVLWRKGWKAKGIGFTLKGENDFKLDEFKSGSPETFEPFYGEKGDGNVFDPDNINSLTDLVMKVTKNKGVHFMMADGGFSVEGQENIQELLSKQLYLCQFLVALSIVRTEGHFICKLFDLFSPFSVGLVYLMYRCFYQISIFKPNTSRPANSERYIICKWKRKDTEDVKDYMFRLNERLCELKSDCPEDVNYCVPMEELRNDLNFFEYIISSNNKLGERQIVNLAKISAYYRNSSLVETRQFNLRKECLALWKVPDKMSRMETHSVDDVLKKFFNNSRETVFLHRTPSTLSTTNFSATFDPSVYNWMYSVLGSEIKDLTYFLGLGRNRVMRYLFNSGRWEPVSNCTFELSPGTLVIGEIVPEFNDDRKSQVKNALHIFDSYSLGFQDISNLEFNERMRMSCIYTEAISKLVTPNVSPVRFIQPFSLTEINRVFDNVYPKKLRGEMQLVVSIDDFCFPAKGLLFFSTTKEPWTKRKSKGTGWHYYFNPKTNKSDYENRRPKDSVASFRDCVGNNKVWWWDTGVGLRDEGRRAEVVHKDDLINLIHEKTKS